MKFLFFLFFFIIVVTCNSFTGFSQVTLSGNTAGAELVKVLTISNTTALNFGVIGITEGAAGIVLMKTSGVRTSDAATTTFISSGTTNTVAKFCLTGTTDDTYSVILPSIITVTTDKGSGERTMNIEELMVNIDNKGEIAASVVIGTLKSGISTFLMSGKLNISANQELGVYKGVYNVTVDYN